MRLDWTKNKNPTIYRAVKTIRVNGKNKTLPTHISSLYHLFHCINCL